MTMQNSRTSVCVYLQRLDISSSRHRTLFIFILVYIDILDVILFILHRQPTVACRDGVSAVCCGSLDACLSLQRWTQLDQARTQRTDNCQVPLTMVMTEAPIILLLWQMQRCAATEQTIRTLNES